MQVESVVESVAVEGGVKVVMMRTLQEERPCHRRESLIQRLREMMNARPPAMP